MKEYKRLTTKCEVGIGLSETSGNIVNDYEKVINRLAELEDKIENGTLYGFPFRIGQEVYIVCDWDIDKVVKGTISEIELTTNKNGTFHRIYVDHEYIFSKTNLNVVKYRYIFTAQELFTDKAEAEAKLKEQQNER